MPKYRYSGSPETLACGLPVVAGAETDRVDPKAEPDASMIADGRLIKLDSPKRRVAKKEDDQ